MITEANGELARRAAMHGALADPARLVITVCDMAHEELGELAAVHWSVPDPVPAGDDASFDLAVDELGRRIGQFAPRVQHGERARSGSYGG